MWWQAAITGSTEGDALGIAPAASRGAMPNATMHRPCAISLAVTSWEYSIARAGPGRACICEIGILMRCGSSFFSSAAIASRPMSSPSCSQTRQQTANLALTETSSLRRYWSRCEQSYCSCKRYRGSKIAQRCARNPGKPPQDAEYLT